jgi:hypothetical protein
VAAPDALVRPDMDGVTDTVKVTPVGKPVCDTAAVSAMDGDADADTRPEGDTGTEGEPVPLLERVSRADCESDREPRAVAEGGWLSVTGGLVDTEGERRPVAEVVTLTEDVFDAEAEPVAVREAAPERVSRAVAVAAAVAEPRPSPPPPVAEGEPLGDTVGAGARDSVPVPLTLGVPRPDTLAEPHAEGVLELVAEREGVEDTLGQRDAATVALWVAEMRALPERRSDAVALGEAEGVLDAGALRERVAQPVGLLLDVVEAVAVFDGGAVRAPVAHDDAVRVVDMVRVPEGEPEGDIDAETEPVAVVVRTGEPVRLPVSEKEGEPVAVLDAVMLREPVVVPVPVLLALAERLADGVPVAVREADTEDEAVFVAATVRVDVVLAVCVRVAAMNWRSWHLNSAAAAAAAACAGCGAAPLSSS